MCVLHIDPAIIGEIRQFENDTWAKVNDAVSQRQTLFRESKYFKIKLEYIVSDMDGYHVQCYGNFTAVRKVTVEDSSAETKQGNLRSTQTFNPYQVLEFFHMSVCSVEKYGSHRENSEPGTS